MKLGAEPQKVALLGLLGLVLAYVVWDNLLSGPETTPVTASMPKPNIAPTPMPGSAVPGERPAANITRKKMAKSGAAEQFRPSLQPKRGPNGEVLRPDPLKVDPQLQLAILEKLSGVRYSGPGRNLFEFGTAPPPDPAKPDIKIDVKPAKPKIEPMRYATAIGPAKDPPPPPEPPPPPQPPPITFKFYGFVGPRGTARKAFFLDGEEIFMAAEGDLIKNRWKVVRIGLSNAELQDTQFPHARPQQVPLAEEAPSA